MNQVSWDPLKNADSFDQEVISAAQKRQIRNILKSYVGMFDSFSELIQNAMDAVEKRERLFPDNEYEKHIYLTINLQDNSFQIVDNGIGFNKKEFESFLAPNISFKDSKGTRGNKGVGATYIGYGFNEIIFGTKGNGHDFLATLRNGRDWVEDSEGLVTRPEATKCIESIEDFELIDRGSIFRIKFGGEFVRPKDLGWTSAATPEQWRYLLLLKTPLGTIDFISQDNLSIKFDLTVIDKEGKSQSITEQDCTYIYPHQVINYSPDLKEIIKFEQKLSAQGRDPSSLPQKFKNVNGLYEFFTKEDLLGLVTTTKGHEDIVALIEMYEVEAYGYFTYSTAVWDQFNDKVAKLRKGFRVLRGGLQLANNRMLQGELIAIPLTSNIGYQNQCHVIIHFRDADPDLGRKGFQPELKVMAEKLSVRIVNRFKNRKRLLKSDTGSKPDIEGEISLHQWIREQEEHEKLHPLNLTNKNFFAPINEISISSVPQSEQDTIVLFNQLIAGGVIRGIKLLATSQVKQYDGVFKFVVREPLSHHYFDKSTNPLGVDELNHRSELTTPLKVLEYKYNLDGLIREFESGDKKESDIHLAICWELGELWKKEYQALSFLDLDNIHHRPFHGLTHKLMSGHTELYVICLKELLDYLNNVDGVQMLQRDRYTDDMFDIDDDI